MKILQTTGWALVRSISPVQEFNALDALRGTSNSSSVHLGLYLGNDGEPMKNIHGQPSNRRVLFFIKNAVFLNIDGKDLTFIPSTDIISDITQVGE